MGLEVQKANRLLENGPRTYSYVCAVADKLAFAIVARSYGIEQTARALRAGSAVVEPAKIPFEVTAAFMIDAHAAEPVYGVPV